MDRVILNSNVVDESRKPTKEVISGLLYEYIKYGTNRHRNSTIRVGCVGQRS